MRTAMGWIASSGIWTLFSKQQGIMGSSYVQSQPSRLFRHRVRQSRSHLQCCTQAQPLMPQYTHNNALQRRPGPYRKQSCTETPAPRDAFCRHRRSCPRGHSLKLMDTFGCTETQSLSLYPGLQPYKYIHTHTQSQDTYCHCHQRHKPSYIPALLQEASKAEGQEGWPQKLLL